jgi:TfoX/Sxy family transcriptional regulator of competence genes
VATEEGFVEHIQSQSGLGDELSFKKMFGEYALYLHGKVVAFACDNQLYVKPTEEGRALLGSVSEHPAYPGSKLYFRIDEQTEDRELLRQLFETTARVLPLPKPKVAKVRTDGAGSKARRGVSPRGVRKG